MQSHPLSKANLFLFKSNSLNPSEERRHDLRVPAPACRYPVCLFVAVMLIAGSLASADNSPSKSDERSAQDDKANATHKQLRVIKPMRDGKPVTLLNYCLDKSGDLWMSISTGSRHQDAGVGSPSEVVNAVQIYDPDGQLKAEHPIGFKATAMNFALDGTLLVSGEGKIARLDSSGKVLKESATPNITNLDDFKNEIVEAAKKEQEKSNEAMNKQIEMMEGRIKSIESKEPDEAKRTAQDKSMIRTLKTQLTRIKQLVEMNRSSMSPEALLSYKLAVPGVAGTAKEVYVVLSVASGYGYQVWRTNYNFEEGKVVADKLAGCCGNMDVQARGEGFVTCENGEFKVVAHDREGKTEGSFGKRDRTAADGFGSCCNPMNCRSLDNGDYIVAESSIGNIKKFSTDGKFIEVVGKAKISGGCKHCAIGFDEKKNRYYMMNEDRNHVCVLVPIAEAPELTEDERLAKEAKEGLAKQLVGVWRADKPTADSSSASPLEGLLNVNGRTNAKKDLQMTVQENGVAKIIGGMFDSLGNREMTWEPVQQKQGNLEFALYLDGVEFTTLQVKFDGEDRMEFVNNNNYYFNGTKALVRAKPSDTTKEPTK